MNKDMSRASLLLLDCVLAGTAAATMIMVYCCPCGDAEIAAAPACVEGQTDRN